MAKTASDLRVPCGESVEFGGAVGENEATNTDGPDAELVPPAGPTDQHLKESDRQ